MDTETRKLFHAIDDEIVQLFYRWKIFSQLFDSDKEAVQLLNQSGSNVFALLQTLIIENTYLTLARLTDPERTGVYENLSIRNLVAKIEADLNENLRKNVCRKLAKLDAVSKSLRKHRNKRIAHLDIDHAIKLKSLPSVTYGDLEDALELVRSIMQDIWLALFNASVWYNPHIAYGCDGEYLLRILRKAHQNSASDA